MIGSSRLPYLWTSLTTSISRTEAAVIRHFQARMPYGLVVRGYYVTRASAHPVRRPDPPGWTTGRDLPRRTGLRRVMTN
jgi:hypothetical protein